MGFQQIFLWGIQTYLGFVWQLIVTQEFKSGLIKLTLKITIEGITLINLRLISLDLHRILSWVYGPRSDNKLNSRAMFDDTRLPINSDLFD